MGHAPPAAPRHAALACRYGVANAAILVVIFINALLRIRLPPPFPTLFGLAILWCSPAGVYHAVRGILEVRRAKGVPGFGGAVFGLVMSALPVVLVAVSLLVFRSLR
jgi:hypothetical protein